MLRREDTSKFKRKERTECLAKPAMNTEEQYVCYILLILTGNYTLLILLLVFYGNEPLLFFNPPELNLSTPQLLNVDSFIKSTKLKWPSIELDGKDHEAVKVTRVTRTTKPTNHPGFYEHNLNLRHAKPP